METILHPSFPSQVIIGWRVADDTGALSGQDQARRMLVAIVKVTFAADDPAAAPLPAGQQQALELTDVKVDETSDSSPFRYENDVAVFKPRADVVVLGAPQPPAPSNSGHTLPGDVWTMRVDLGVQSMIGTFSAGRMTHLNGTPVSPTFLTNDQAAFQWEPRIGIPEGPRKGHAGDLGLDGKKFKPDQMKLPDLYRNLYWNGGLYIPGSTPAQPAFSHPAAGAVVTVQSTAVYDTGGGGTETRTEIHRLHLPAQFPRAVLTYRRYSLPDSPLVQEDVPMKADTIVYDRPANKFYVVWRGGRIMDNNPPAERYVTFSLS